MARILPRLNNLLFFPLQKTLIHQLSKKIQHDQQQIDEKQHQIFYLQKDIQKQQKLQDEKELHEFLHTENLALTETLADTEIENERLKEIIERKDGELSKSEEQCRHLVRVNQQRHQEVLSAKSKAKSLESKARSMILQQVILTKSEICNFTAADQKNLKNPGKKTREIK